MIPAEVFFRLRAMRYDAMRHEGGGGEKGRGMDGASSVAKASAVVKDYGGRDGGQGATVPTVDGARCARKEFRVRSKLTQVASY